MYNRLGLTPTRQHVLVGEGLAVGAVALGAESIRAQKMLVEFAFEHAWRTWNWVGEFSNVRVEKYSDITHILRESTRRRGPIVAEWGRRGDVFTPRLTHDDWTPKEAAEAIRRPLGSGPDFADWCSLAAQFLGYFQAGHVTWN